MGSIIFSENGEIKVEKGSPEDVWYKGEGVVMYTKQMRAKHSDGRYVELPNNLKELHRAMSIAVPPTELFVNSVGQCGLKGDIQTMFGSGQCSSSLSEWHPTNLVVDDARAWVLRHYCPKPCKDP